MDSNNTKQQMAEINNPQENKKIIHSNLVEEIKKIQDQKDRKTAKNKETSSKKRFSPGLVVLITI